MSTAFTIIIIIPGVWITVMLSLKGMAFLLRRQTEKAAQTVLHAEAILRITDNASYLGADFSGPNLPPRTSGVLALTAERLYFLPWFPRKSISLPRGTVSEVLTRPSFKNLGYNIPALVLRVKGVGDPEGEMGWLVHDPEGWERDIKEMLESQELGAGLRV